jgi:hypothetical protein
MSDTVVNSLISLPRSFGWNEKMLTLRQPDAQSSGFRNLPANVGSPCSFGAPVKRVVGGVCDVRKEHSSRETVDILTVGFGLTAAQRAARAPHAKRCSEPAPAPDDLRKVVVP